MMYGEFGKNNNQDGNIRILTTLLLMLFCSGVAMLVSTKGIQAKKRFQIRKLNLHSPFIIIRRQTNETHKMDRAISPCVERLK